MLSRVEHEMNLNWADQNPDLFVKAVREFQDKYANYEWDVSIQLNRKHYVTLVANYVTLVAKRHFKDA